MGSRRPAGPAVRRSLFALAPGAADASVSARSVVVLWSVRLTTAAAGFLTQILLARALGLSGYGTFATALSLVGFLLPLAGFGVPAYWLRAFGRGRTHGLQAARPGLRLVWLSALVVSGVACALALALPLPAEARVPALVLTAWIPSQAILAAAGAVYQIRLSFTALAICVGLPYGARLAVAAAALAVHAGPLLVAIGYALTSLALAAAYLPTALRVAGREAPEAADGAEPAMPNAARPLAEVASRVWPFALAGFFYATYMQGTVALLGLVAGPEAAGLLSVAVSVVSLGYLFPSVVFQQVLLPYLNRWLEHDRERFARTFEAALDRMLAVSLAFTGVCAGLGPLLVPVVFGSHYAAAKPLLAALAVCLPIRFLSATAESVLLTEADMRRRVRGQGAAAVLGSVALLLLAPHYGVWGGLAAMLVSEGTVLASYASFVRRFVLGGGVLRLRLGIQGSAALGLSALCVAVNLVGSRYDLAVGLGSAAAAVAVSAFLLARGVRTGAFAGWTPRRREEP